MKTTITAFVTLLFLFAATGCDKEMILTERELDAEMSELGPGGLKSATKSAQMATGSVEVLRKAKGADQGNQPDDLRAFFKFDAIEGDEAMGDSPKGQIIYQVTAADLTLHREIIADVFGVFVNTIDDDFDGDGKNDLNKAWIVATVVSDSKGCGGDAHGGHDSGCSDSGHTDEGGCGDDTSHDEGCTHDEPDTGTGEEGGCSGGTGEEGGCSGGTGEEGGCSGGTGEEGNETDHGSGSPGGGEMGNPLSGKNCRIGQVIAVKVHDMGTPGVYDGITWKWFDPASAPAINDLTTFRKLCKKTIIGGNLVVHK